MAQDKAIALLTIAGEASNQPHEARIGVAESLFNRLRIGGGYYGKTIAAICLRRFQFSEWNGDALDRTNLLRVAEMSDTDPVILDCAAAYDTAESGSNLVDGATHFYATTIPAPPWALGPSVIETARLGALVFLKGVN